MDHSLVPLVNSPSAAELDRLLTCPPAAPGNAGELQVACIEVVQQVIELSGPVGDANLALLFDNFASLGTEQQQPVLSLSVQASGDTYDIQVNGSTWCTGVTAEELIYDVEGIVVPALQLLRPDLLFLHAACLSYQGQGCLLVGPSGAGKSTLCWALCHHGFSYLSDEMAPLEVPAAGTDGVFLAHAYAHAVCMKHVPPAPYDQSTHAFTGGRTWHLPVTDLPAGRATEALPLTHIFYVSHEIGGTPAVANLSLLSAAQQLYTQILNALAHPAKGLPASVALASSVRNLSLTSADLDATCQLILHTLQDST